jgi:hypothetical protein
MGHLIESLESRLLLSGTTAVTLAAAGSLIASDGAAVTSDLDELGTLNAEHDKVIGDDLEGIETRTDEKILKVLTADGKKAAKVFTAADTTLNKTADALAGKAVIAGDALLLTASKANIAKVKVAIAALGKVTVKPLAILDAQLASTTLENEFEVLRAANSSDSTLGAAITARETGATAQKVVISAAAEKFKTDVAALAADLASIL